MTTNNGNVPENQDAVAEENKLKLLNRIDRTRGRLIVCFYTLPIYIIALVMLLNEGRDVMVFMFVYMAVYAFFAIDMVVKVCPGCKGQYFVKSFFLNFLTRKCVHCGLSSRGIHSEVESPHERKF